VCLQIRKKTREGIQGDNPDWGIMLTKRRRKRGRGVGERIHARRGREIPVDGLRGGRGRGLGNNITTFCQQETNSKTSGEMSANHYGETMGDTEEPYNYREELRGFLTRQKKRKPGER